MTDHIFIGDRRRGTVESATVAEWYGPISSPFHKNGSLMHRVIAISMVTAARNAVFRLGEVTWLRRMTASTM